MEGHKTKSKKSKAKQIDISKEVTLSFKFDDYEPFINKYIPLRKNSARAYSDMQIDILDQSNLKFILNIPETKNCYSKYSNQVNSNLNWDDINIVIYYSVDIYTCPICLEKNLVCPIITRCAHIFCWPCIENYQKYCNGVNAKKELSCPLCKEAIDMEYIKFCKIVQSHSYTEGSDTITFNLVMKDKKAPILYNVYQDPDLEYYRKNFHRTKKDLFSFIPCENSQEFSFSRIFLTTPKLLRSRYFDYLNDLNTALKDEESGYFDENRIKAIKSCILEMDALILSIRDEEIEEIEDVFENQSTVDDEGKIEEIKIDYGVFLYFYQEQYGDIYFLHPINYKIFLSEYNSEDQLPTDITV